MFRKDFQNIYGVDILKDDFDLQNWRNLVGKYITDFLIMLRNELNRKKISLSVGLPRGDIIGPPLGNITLDWREWIKNGLVDELIINQNSCQCPSMWHRLWPMHVGSGYMQNYLEGYNLPSIKEHLKDTYFPVISRVPAKLYIARQWNQRSEEEESDSDEYESDDDEDAMLRAMKASLHDGSRRRRAEERANVNLPTLNQ